MELTYQICGYVSKCCIRPVFIIQFWDAVVLYIPLSYSFALIIAEVCRVRYRYCDPLIGLVSVTGLRHGPCECCEFGFKEGGMSGLG